MANIELDGANKKIKVDSGDLTLDVPGDIVLDADGGDVVFADGGTNLLKVTNSSSDVVLQPQVDAKDIIFKQYDGTTVATVEDNGTFNVPANKLAIGGTAVTATAAELNLIDGGTARGTTAIADGDGVLINDAGTMRQTTVETLKTYIGGFDVSSITGATALDEIPASTDEFVFSDNGTLKRVDFSYLQVAGSSRWSASRSSGQSVANSTATTILWNVVTDATGVTNTLSSNGRITIGAGQAGWYVVTAINRYADLAGTLVKEKMTIKWYDNSASSTETIAYAEMNSSGTYDTKVATGLKYLDVNDYVYVSVNQNGGGSESFVGGNGTGFYGFRIA